MMTDRSLTAVSILVGALAAGAAYGLSFYAIPVAMRTRSVSNKATQLSDLWKFGHRSLPLSYVCSGLLHLYLAWHVGSHLETLAGVLTLSIVPFSIIIIEPTDRKMLSVKGRDDASVVKELGGVGVLDDIAWQWSRLNAVRATMALVGAGVSFLGLIQ